MNSPRRECFDLFEALIGSSPQAQPGLSFDALVPERQENWESRAFSDVAAVSRCRVQSFPIGSTNLDTAPIAGKLPIGTAVQLENGRKVGTLQVGCKAVEPTAEAGTAFLGYRFERSLGDQVVVERNDRVCLV